MSLWSANLGTNIANGLLVWRNVLPERETAGAGEVGPTHGGDIPTTDTCGQAGAGDAIAGKPRRSYGSIALDPDKAGLQVAKIAEEVLFELGRPDGAVVTLTLEIDALSPAGYPDDVVDVVRSNVRDLKLRPGDVGFEEE